jgi:hypothetical protein
MPVAFRSKPLLSRCCGLERDFCSQRGDLFRVHGVPGALFTEVFL